ncbi:hypothetical protein HDE_12857 [Halotydeus destructor]|nr:hypothetical protein HDE_12857 [Halotydeus destructor]
MQENESDEVKAVMATCSAKLGTVMPRTAKEKKDQRCDTAYKNKMADFRVCFVKESKAKNVDFRSVHGKAQEFEKIIMEVHHELPFNRLNDHCLADIFKYLQVKDRIKFERVNRQWFRVLMDTWRRQRVLSFVRMKNEYLFCVLEQHRVEEIDSVAISNRYVDDEEIRMKFFRVCPNLKLIVLDHCNSKAIVESIVEHCEAVEHVANCDGFLSLHDTEARLTNMTCAKVFVNSSDFDGALKMKVPRLSLYGKAGDEQVDKMLQHGGHVEKLVAHTSFDTDSLAKLLPHMTNLKSIQAAFFYDDGRCKLVSAQQEIFWNGKNEAVLRKLVKTSSSSLRSIQINEALTLDTIEYIVNTCPGIRHFDMKYPADLKSCNSVRLMASLKRLRSFEIMLRNFDIRQITEFFSRCVKLRRLRIVFFEDFNTDQTSYLQFIFAVVSYAKTTQSERSA